MSRSRARSCGIIAGLLLQLSSAQTPLPAGQPSSAQLDLGAGVTLEIVRMPAGTFTQQVPDEAGREVTISKPYWLGRTEVTRAQFARFVAAANYRTDAERGRSGGFGWNGRELEQRPTFTWRSPGFQQTDAHPVCIVSYGDALEFCRWASKVTGRRVSLPTEAQWEHACRLGGEPRDLASAAWYDRTAGAGTHPVATAIPDALGLHDLRGNLYEWCLDWFEPYPLGTQRDPLVANSTTGSTRRVLRGGSWRHDVKNCAAGARWRSDPGSRSCDNGFRVAVVDGSAAGAASTPPAPRPVDREPPPTRRDLPAPQPAPADETGCLWSPWVLGPLALVALLLLVKLFGKSPTPPAGSAPPRPNAPRSPAPSSRPAASGLRQQVQVELAADGAWLRASQTLGELLVRARHRAGNQAWQEVRVRLFGKQFVYTGHRPQQLEVLEVVPASGADATWGATGATQRDPRDVDASDDDDHSAGGFAAGMSAY
jgi:sulfatase modifying factor 1